MGSVNGDKAFVISGIFETISDALTSRDNANWVMRRLKVFAESDSLAIDNNLNEACFFTEMTPEEFLGSFDKIATFSGCIPQFEELVARDWISDEFDPRAYVQIGQYEILSPGGLLHAPSECDSNELELVFLAEKYVPFDSNSTRAVLVSGNPEGVVRIDTRPGDDVPFSILSA